MVRTCWRMKTCDDCRFCCWSYGVDELHKRPMQHCGYECSKGCAVHCRKPKQCADFSCPYLHGDAIYSPMLFQSLLKEVGCNLKSFIPYVALSIPLEKAFSLIRSTRSIPAAIKADKWTMVVLALDQISETLFSASEEQRKAWA